MAPWCSGGSDPDCRYLPLHDLSPAPTLVDGQVRDTVSVHERGLQYGDGLFETIGVENGAPQLWDKHYARLVRGCERLLLPTPDEDLLRREAIELCKGAPRAVLKLILTRGRGGRGYGMPRPIVPTRILALHPWPEIPAQYYERGVAVRLCSTRLSRNPLLAGIKHLNRLEQVLARSECSDPAIAEGLMQDTHGQVIEGTMTNVFVVLNGTLITPDLSQCGVCGIMRELIIERAKDSGVITQIGPIDLDMLYAAEEVFLCNSIIGIWPVRCLKGRAEHGFRQMRIGRALMGGARWPLNV